MAFIVKTTNLDPLITTPIYELSVGRAEDTTLLHCVGIKIDHPDIFPSIDSRLIHTLYTGPAATLHPSSKLHSQYLFHSACLIKAWRGIWPQWDGEEVSHRGYLCVQQGLGNFSFKFLSFSLPDIFCDSTLEVLLGFWSSTETTDDRIEVMWRPKLKFVGSASWGEGKIPWHRFAPAGNPQCLALCNLKASRKFQKHTRVILSGSVRKEELYYSSNNEYSHSLCPVAWSASCILDRTGDQWLLEWWME